MANGYIIKKNVKWQALIISSLTLTFFFRSFLPLINGSYVSLVPPEKVTLRGPERSKSKKSKIHAIKGRKRTVNVQQRNVIYFLGLVWEHKEIEMGFSGPCDQVFAWSNILFFSIGRKVIKRNFSCYNKAISNNRPLSLFMNLPFHLRDTFSIFCSPWEGLLTTKDYI